LEVIALAVRRQRNLSRSPAPDKRQPGRPKRADARVIPWQLVGKAVVHGEVMVDLRSG